ncbi:Dolichyl-diphosphooligosaccharide--protein glycosyltransferase subunit 1B [Hirschfeldia incana]|nr:Dolichyl-diphosphooligosaccharide--protein glycosyltransferase subunit 1B [Hirschfeldia incana]
MGARIWIFAVVVALFLSLPSSSSAQDLQIVNAERRIDLSSHIVKAFLTLKVENIGKAPAADMLLAFPPTQIKQLSMVQALAITGKKKKKAYLPLDVKPTEQPDAPNDTGYFLVTFATPLAPGETVTLEVLYILTHSLEPFPSEITQSEAQLVYYRDSAVILSPYHIKQQTTFFKTPSARVESFTSVEPANRAGKEIKYGPYEDRAPYSYAPVIVHFENNSPFAVVEELVREIEISHWGSVQVTENYRLTHGGARHKGVFSRVDYQSRRSISGSSSFNGLLAVLPPRVNSVYYRDDIGNISTSHLRTGFKKSELEFEPRYPLFGGWRATFIIGYRVPLEDYLFEAPDGRRYLNFTFGCPLVETIVNKLTIKVVLPEGSKDPSAVLPFTVNQDLQVKYSYLDIVGRTVVVLQKDNVVPTHNVPFQVYYTFKPIYMLAEPFMLVSAFFFVFVASLAYVHIDLNIVKK